MHSAATHILNIIDQRAQASSSCDQWLLHDPLSSSNSTLSFLQLSDYCRRGASWFANYLCNTPQEIIPIFVDNSARSVVAIVSALRYGLPVLPLNPNTSKNFYANVLSKFFAGMIFNASNDNDVLDQYDCIEFPDLSKLPNYYYQLPSLPINFNCFIFLTSGSTAVSKIAPQTYLNLISNAESIVQHLQLSADNLVLNCLPLYHVNGLHFGVFASILSGSRVILMSSYNSFVCLSLMKAFQPSFVNVVPSILKSLCLAYESRGDLFSISTLFISAASPLSSTVAMQVDKLFKCKILQGYGLTETTNFSTMIPIDISDQLYIHTILKPLHPSVGIALDCNTICIQNSQGDQAPLGEIGEICFRGKNVFPGYLHTQDDLTFTTQGYFRTGDLGKLDSMSDGRVYLTITGRSKNITKINGNLLSFESLEAFLLQYSSVSDVACFSPYMHDNDTALYIFYSSHSPLGVEYFRNALSAYFNTNIPPFHICHLSVVPRTATGKILRKEVEQLYIEYFDHS